MTPTVLVESNPAAERIAALSALDASNPFHTPQYVGFRRAMGDTPLLVLECAGSQLVSGCTAFMRSGRLNTLVDVPSRPCVRDDAAFWRAVDRFCRQQRVTQVSVNSFASLPGPMPQLWRVMSTKRRREYVIDLAEAPGTRAMRKGHAYEVKRGVKAGLLLHRSRDTVACETHVRLMNASITRQRAHGKTVTAVDDLKPFHELLASGAGELFQATLHGEVLASSMILLTPSAGYNHTQGASPQGMACGAAHFLIFEIARALHADGRQSFNLGGTDEFGSGLERFKTGFSGHTRCVELDATDYRSGGVWRSFVHACVRVWRPR